MVLIRPFNSERNSQMSMIVVMNHRHDQRTIYGASCLITYPQMTDERDIEVNCKCIHCQRTKNCRHIAALFGKEEIAFRIVDLLSSKIERSSVKKLAVCDHVCDILLPKVVSHEYGTFLQGNIFIQQYASLRRYYTTKEKDGRSYQISIASNSCIVRVP